MKYTKLKPSDFEAIPPKDGKIIARTLDLENNLNYKAVIFSEKDGIFSCLLPVEDTKDELPNLKGLLIQYGEFKVLNSEMRWYVLIECNTPRYINNFTEILKGIIAEIDRGKNDVVNSIHIVISKWRHFLSLPEMNIMKEEDIIGLIGELMLLSKYISESNNKVLDCWVADRGEVDFIKNNKYVEVKSTLKEKHEHIINGIDQLLVLPNKSMYILSLLFIKSNDKEDLNLPLLIKECAEKLNESPERLDLFYKKIVWRGYDIRDHNLYLDYSYRCLKGGYFKVDETFPRVTTEDLKQPLNSRISKVRYTVDMEGLPNRDYFTTEINNIL